MNLNEFFAEHPKAALAFSGGTDSAFLLYAGKCAGADIRPYFVRSQFQPEFEYEDALRLSNELGVGLRVVNADILQYDEVASNPENRCYFCKKRIMNAIRAAAAADGCDTIIDGTNASDEGADRPGMKVLKEQYGGKVPDDFDALLALPGVGRKSANLIMGDVFGKPAIVTDTHCIRLTNRMGLVDNIKEPKKVEMALWKIIPPEEGNDFCHRLVYHGREVCTARTKPYCDKCCLKDICAKKGIEK